MTAIIIVAVLLVLLLVRSNMLSNAILNTSVNYAASQAGQGLGGHSSFGGVVAALVAVVSVVAVGRAILRSI